MTQKNLENINLKAIQFSLVLKILISGWSLYIAIFSEDLKIGVLYLAVAIIFAGLFVFQLKYYRRKKAEKEDSD